MIATGKFLEGVVLYFDDGTGEQDEMVFRIQSPENIKKKERLYWTLKAFINLYAQSSDLHEIPDWFIAVYMDILYINIKNMKSTKNIEQFVSFFHISFELIIKIFETLLFILKCYYIIIDIRRNEIIAKEKSCIKKERIT